MIFSWPKYPNYETMWSYWRSRPRKRIRSSNSLRWRFASLGNRSLIWSSNLYQLGAKAGPLPA